MWKTGLIIVNRLEQNLYCSTECVLMKSKEFTIIRTSFSQKRMPCLPGETSAMACFLRRKFIFSSQF